MPRRKKTDKVQPIERFPAKPRPDGRFQKRIRGHLYYFGAGGDREQALREYYRAKHDLYAGRKPRAQLSDDATTLKALANRFNVEREAEVKSGRLNEDWHGQGVRAIGRFLAHVGSRRVVADLRPEDFSDYGRYLSGELGSHAYNRERESIVTMFRHAWDCAWIESPVRMGKGFSKIAAGTLREERRARLIESRTIIAMLACAQPKIEAMILLAINGGYGGKDSACLRWERVDLKNSLIRNYRRPKTNIDRDTPLWPETVEAISQLRSKVSASDPLVFRTKQGNPWNNIAIAHRIESLTDALGVDVALGDLRHTFATYANETKDTDAVRRIMGQKLPGLKDVYVETLFIPRLREVVNHVRHRIFFTDQDKSPSPTQADSAATPD